MAKKKADELEVEGVEVAEEVKVHEVSQLTSDFGRADLNELRDKVNELAART